MTSQRDSFLLMAPDGFRKDTDTILEQDGQNEETDTKYGDAHDDEYVDRTMANPFKKIYKMSASMSPSTRSKHQLKRFQCAGYGKKLTVDSNQYNPFAIAMREKKRFARQHQARRPCSDRESSSSDDSYQYKPTN